MAIKIYTYSDPYSIDKEPYWKEIENCPHFCVSQTMVNGLENVYPAFKKKGLLTTMMILINSLYSDWESRNTRIRQIMEIDNAISKLSIDDKNSAYIRRSLEFNAQSLASAVRLFVELDVKAEKLSVDGLNNDQKLLVELYKDISSRKNSSFTFQKPQTKPEIEEGIAKALRVKHDNIDAHSYNKQAIVIHGIHQFSASMMCAIEDISRYIDIILLFNYQTRYREIYSTWINIYSLFDVEIGKSNVPEFRPASLMQKSYASNKLADCIGALADGQFRPSEGAFDNLEVIEFANLTEFAGYCTVLFENASEQQKHAKFKAPTLAFMSEQMYSTSGKVNDILRSYFPEQFGERHFLDYPIGHFFVSAINMWDNDSSTVIIKTISDLKECLGAGVLQEAKRGSLLNTFNKVEPFVSFENSLEGIIAKLNGDLRELIIKVDEKLRRVSYVNVGMDELEALIKGLKELNSIIGLFFSDFNDGSDNFQRFYNRIHDFITNRIQNRSDLDDEMKEVIKSLLERLAETNLPETGSFTCLKQTLSYYLSQDDSAGRSASWIVRDFEQIDGDILRSKNQDADGLDISYHFCCLSDKDMSADKDECLPWPLDIHFFETAYEPLDLKYQVFLKSKMEYKNFKRYALLYGLEFNRLKCKLSYIKTEGRKENELYHLISMLGLKVTKYQNLIEDRYRPRTEVQETDTVPKDFDSIDNIKYKICPYRFALESCIQERTIYRDRYLITMYMKLLFQAAVIARKPTEAQLRSIMEKEFQTLDDIFKITNELEKTQIISGLYSDIIKSKSDEKKRKELFEEPEIYKIREDFLFTKNKAVYSDESFDFEDILQDTLYYQLSVGENCKYCASRDICLHSQFE